MTTPSLSVPDSRSRGGIVQFLHQIPKRTWLGFALAIGLWWVFMYYTRFPSVQRKSDILNVLATGAPNTFNELVSREGWPYWLSWIPTGINMNDNNAIGMAFAFLIAGAVSSLVLPTRWVNAMLHSKGPFGSTIGGLMGAPLMMCSACSIPVAIGWRKRGANLETTLGVVVGSALLNIMGLITIWVLFNDGNGGRPAAVARVGASLFMVLVVVPLVASYLQRRWARTAEVEPESVGESDVCCASPINVDAVATPDDPLLRESWLTAAWNVVRDWWWASVGLTYRLWIPMTAAIFLAAFVRLFVPKEVVEQYLGGGPLAIALVALFCTIIAVPTMFEIPMALGFMFLGMGMGPATAMLIAAPSVSIVSYFMLRKDVGSLAPVLLLLATFVIAFVSGWAVELLTLAA